MYQEGKKHMLAGDAEFDKAGAANASKCTEMCSTIGSKLVSDLQTLFRNIVDRLRDQALFRIADVVNKGIRPQKNTINKNSKIK